MKLTLTIETENDDALDRPVGLAAEILSMAARQVHRGDVDMPLRDVNGNTIGRFVFIARETTP